MADAVDAEWLYLNFDALIMIWEIVAFDGSALDDVVLIFVLIFNPCVAMIFWNCTIAILLEP